MLLCDSAQAVGNKLYILGGGWSVTGPEPVPSALALYVKVPWDEANIRQRLRLELVDSDGREVLAGEPDAGEPIQIETEFEVGRPAGLTPGTPIDVSLAINLGALPLPPGGRYEWRLTVNGEVREGWSAAFSTRPATSA